jgi:D-serine deaminase-like pyridoxal phosphate-dependent protein
VDTPALVLDLDAFEANLAALADAVAGSGVRVRAHAKTHKCVEIARRQVAGGAVGMCCQKVSEAEALVAGGIADVLVTNEVVGAAKLERLAALAGRAKIGVCVDDAGNARDIDAAARHAGTRLDAYIEVDVGARRCGVAPGAPALELARVVAACPNLRLAGLQAYHGSAQHLRGMGERRDAIERAALAASQTRRLLESAGIACPTVTGAGSGSFMFELASGAYDEIQPGSYIFMDADYAKNEWAPPLPRFRHALFILATVMSRPSADRAVVDAGLKASSVDSGMPVVWEQPGLRYTRPSDEHGVIEIAAGARAPALGDKLLLVPGHCDPTVNLHDWYVCVRDRVVESVWQVSARGALF